MTEIRTRFAPSPTGHLHIGGARTALFNWLLARSQGGKFVLRIEDTDMERSTEEYTQAILDAMTWLDLDWDEGPFFQSQRTALHLEYIQKLLDSGHAYYCHCTPDELTKMREEAMASGGKPRYDGRCRNKHLGPASGAVVRFKTQQTGVTQWMDLVKGGIAFDNSELDDLVILKSDGMPTYNMAVVVDDVAMNITHVIRGDDHVNNTPRQIQLYQGLGAPTPVFGHVPMILGADKTRLSKRHGATSVMAYKDMGYLPEALVNYLVRLGWSHGDQEIFSRAELVEKFNMSSVGKSASVFDPEKFLWLSGLYIKEAPLERLAGLIGPFLAKRNLPEPPRDILIKAVHTVHTRARTVDEIAEMIAFYFIDPVQYDPQAAAKFLKPDMTPLFDDLTGRLKQMEAITEPAVEALFTRLVADHDIKLGKIAQPVRVALTGKTASPGLFEVMDVLGKEKVMSRLAQASAFLASQAS